MNLKLLACSFAVCSLSLAQVPSWQWAKSAGRYTSHDYCSSLSTDKAGNSYITGQFQDSIDFGSTTLFNSGTYNHVMYIAKYDISGNLIWAIQPGGNNQSQGNGICTDNNGNFFITGSYKGAIIFGSATFSAPWTDNYFLAKYDSSGNVLWARNAIIHAAHLGTSVCTGLDGSVFVTGTYEDSSITFGSVTLSSFPAILNTNIFIVKYDNAGTVLWAKSSGGTLQTMPNAICADQDGNSYLTGVFRNSITFGSTTLTGANGAASVFSVKYDELGNVLWAKGSGGFPSSGYGTGIGTDASGNCYVSGYFNSAIIIFEQDTLTSAGSNDLFLIKYDPVGNLIWSKRMGAGNYEQANNLLTDLSGNCYVTGFYINYTQFGSTSLFGTGLEVFLVKIDSSGNAVWALSSHGSVNERGNGIGIDVNNNIYVGGEFSSPLSTFGNTTLVNSDPFTGSYDLFIAKISMITAITEPEISSNDLEIFPNPFTESTTFKFNQTGNTHFSLLISDCHGRLVQVLDHLNSGKIDWYRQNLPAGLYFVQLRSGQHVL